MSRTGQPPACRLTASSSPPSRCLLGPLFKAGTRTKTISLAGGGGGGGGAGGGGGGGAVRRGADRSHRRRDLGASAVAGAMDPGRTAPRDGRVGQLPAVKRVRVARIVAGDLVRADQIAASPLLAEVIGYLGGEADGGAAAPRRGGAGSDLLTSISVTSLDVRFPDDQLAGPVARALRDNPADQRTLAEWGHVVGASERTLARAFVASHRSAVRPVADPADCVIQSALPVPGGG